MGQSNTGKKRTRRRFSDEFKRDAVDLVRTSGHREIVDAAAGVGRLSIVCSLRSYRAGPQARRGDQVNAPG